MSQTSREGLSTKQQYYLHEKVDELNFLDFSSVHSLSSTLSASDLRQTKTKTKTKNSIKRPFSSVFLQQIQLLFARYNEIGSSMFLLYDSKFSSLFLRINEAANKIFFTNSQTRSRQPLTSFPKCPYLTIFLR